MDTKKDAKISAIVAKASAEFFKRESDRTSMITITRVELQNKGKKAIVYVTIFPEEKEADALEFAKRKRSDLHEFLIKETGLAIVPFVDIVIDFGEKNRQKLDNIKI